MSGAGVFCTGSVKAGSAKMLGYQTIEDKLWMTLRKYQV